MKKHSIYLTLALSVLAQSFSSNLEATDPEMVIVEYNSKVAAVGFSGNNLTINPIDTNVVFYVGNEGAKNKLSILKADDEDVTFPEKFDFSQTKNLAKEKGFSFAPKEDITHELDIKRRNNIFYFHNAGYLHTANTHQYLNCMFHFENDRAAVSLSGKSSQNNATDFLTLLFNNNKTNPINFHKPIVSETCFLKDMVVTSFDKNDRNVNMHMSHLGFGNELSLDSWWRNASLTLKPNTGFEFVPVETNN